VEVVNYNKKDQGSKPRPLRNSTSQCQPVRQNICNLDSLLMLTMLQFLCLITVCFDPPLLKMSHCFIQNCCCITASFTTSRMNSCTLSLHWFCLCWRCYHPYTCDHLQADSVLRSMPLLLHWASVIMAQDKTPKRGCRWPVVENPHRLRLTCCPPHDWSSTARVAHQDCRYLGWDVLTPENM